MVGKQILNALPTNLIEGIGHANGVSVNDVDVNLFDQIVTSSDQQACTNFLDFAYQNNISWMHHGLHMVAFML